ncbi:polymerase [Mesorhizobium sp. M00.F.Ca.ET.220.01.1.1]|nr:polymerase [Mesorhizobium sp. M00.F.Ca.ET.220.01.1.1]
MLAVQPGKTIANLFAALLLAGVVVGAFLVFGRPLWPERSAHMVVLLPVDTIATGSAGKACLEPCLPARFDLKLAPARPSDDVERGNQPAAHSVD